MATTNHQMSAVSEKDSASVWHPFTQMQTAQRPTPIVKAEGVYLYTEDGSRLIDAISSWWVNLHGHAHPYIVQQLCAQAALLDHVIFADFTHSPAAELASRLISILPGKMGKCFFSDNGSTAVEVALKMALQYWHNRNTPKNKVICFKSSYHGDTFGAMSAAGRNAFNKPFWKHLFDVHAIDVPLIGNEEIALNQLRAHLERGDVACFIFEPLILGCGGMLIYEPHVLSRLIKLCREYQVLTIADEVMTGFGRTGTLFACDQLAESPDLICLSKGLTGGFLPLAVTACKQEIFESFLGEHLSQAFLHGHSYTANPIACRTALASLDLLLTECSTSQRKRIADSHAAFCKRWKSHVKLKRCESLGTILVLEYEVDSGSYFHAIRDRLYAFFLSKQILLRPLGNVLYVMPPYCITDFELNSIYEQIICTLEGDL